MMVTTEPNELCAQLHNRMPVILAPTAWPAWLAEEPADEARLRSFLAPFPPCSIVDPQNPGSPNRRFLHWEP